MGNRNPEVSRAGSWTRDIRPPVVTNQKGGHGPAARGESVWSLSRPLRQTGCYCRTPDGFVQLSGLKSRFGPQKTLQRPLK